ncbi:methylthioribose kinase [Fictibacillus phosphorivorans]|uniref:Methylthioribose kinase n=1 Tax=Fictibacillus phosphorivorans TaxID=1221500 RepID=A0A165MTR9_9BACL|nr:methylthioribose kinase [Fictibacillus phosphorivorans]KZE63335.1 methylthioribose kinase [Fictibacillus phosphorivorans]
MIQRFIELGEGYSDLYELLEIMESNKDRITQLLCLKVKKEDKIYASLVAVMQPASEGKFQPLYICREGVPFPSKRYELFETKAAQLNKEMITFDVKSSKEFAETELFYHYLIGILRLNYLIPPLS